MIPTLSNLSLHLFPSLGLNTGNTLHMCVTTVKVPGSHVVVTDFVNGMEFDIHPGIPVMYVDDQGFVLTELNPKDGPRQRFLPMIVIADDKGEAIYWGYLCDFALLASTPTQVLTAPVFLKPLADFKPAELGKKTPVDSPKASSKKRDTPPAKRATKKPSKPEVKKKDGAEAEKAEAMA